MSFEAEQSGWCEKSECPFCGGEVLPYVTHYCKPSASGSKPVDKIEKIEASIDTLARNLFDCYMRFREKYKDELEIIEKRKKELP